MLGCKWCVKLGNSGGHANEGGLANDLAQMPTMSACGCGVQVMPHPHWSWARWRGVRGQPHLRWSWVGWVCGGMCEDNLTHVGHWRGGCVAGCVRTTSPTLVTGEVGVWQDV